MWRGARSSCSFATVSAVLLVKLKCQPHVIAAEIGQAEHTRTHKCTQIEELLSLFHGLCRWRKRMPMQKDQNPSARETSVLLPAAEQEGGRDVQQVFCPSSKICSFCTVCPWLFAPTRYLFLDPFYVEMSVLSAYRFEDALPESLENTVKEKNQCILKQ